MENNNSYRKDNLLSNLNKLKMLWYKWHMVQNILHKSKLSISGTIQQKCSQQYKKVKLSYTNNNLLHMLSNSWE
jgi:hypothetical protein